MSEYPTLQEVLAMHEVLIETFGGREGIQDVGAFEAALMRSQLGYYQTPLEEAAALMESLANNHPFIDGNKRVAFFVTDTFLRLDSKMIDVDADETYTHLMTLFERQSFRFEELHVWLQEVVVELA